MQISGPGGPTGPMGPGPISHNEYRREAAQIAERMKHVLDALRLEINKPDQVDKLLKKLADLVESMNSLMEYQSGSFSKEEIELYDKISSSMREMFENPESITSDQIRAIWTDVRTFYDSVNDQS